MIHKLLLTSYLMLVSLEAEAPKFITNGYREDGFGAQFQGIIYSAIYAELCEQEFVYTPFHTMEHNYNNDPDFLHKKERLINFIGNFPINTDKMVQQHSSFRDLYAVVEKNIQFCAQSKNLKKIKTIFRENKARIDYFDDDHLHIAVHIRRPNSHDSRIEGANTPDHVYEEVMRSLRNTYASCKLIFHIYSQGDVTAYQNVFGAQDVCLHINTSVEETFSSMVLADVLVLSRSSFSYAAALISEGAVYYMPFWHPPLPDWVVCGQ